MQWLSTSRGAQRGGAELVETETDGDGRTVARTFSRRRAQPDATQAGIYAPTAAGSGSRIYLDALRYHGEMRFQSVVPV